MESSGHEPEPISVAPAPWTLRGTVYIFMVYTTSSGAATLSADPNFIYAPLEANSSFSKAQVKGGLSMVQLIRYTESPVGPYDEMVLIPGYFEYKVETKDKNGKTKLEKRKNLRCTKVFVSQKKTCWNGRKNWNIPKHLAHFDFVDLPKGQTRITVYPLLPDTSGQERIKSHTPFFTTIFRPMSYVPTFPCSTALSKYVGLDLGLVQPPLPDGEGPELVGTLQWAKVAAVESSKKTSLGWFDLEQKKEGANEQDPLLGEQHNATEDVGVRYGNFWPGLGRWRFGIKMDEAVIEFPEADHFEGLES